MSRHPSSAGPGLGKHGLQHIHAIDHAGGSHQGRGDEAFDAPAAAQVQDTLPRLQIGLQHRTAAAVAPKPEGRRDVGDELLGIGQGIEDIGFLGQGGVLIKGLDGVDAAGPAAASRQL